MVSLRKLFNKNQSFIVFAFIITVVYIRSIDHGARVNFCYYYFHAILLNFIFYFNTKDYDRIRNKIIIQQMEYEKKRVRCYYY